MAAPFAFRPPRTGGESARLAQYIQRWADALQARATLRFSTRNISANGHALPGELLVCDTDVAALRVTVPGAAADNAGAQIVIANRGANAVTVTPLSGTVNTGAASLTVAAGVSYLLVSDGQSNWSPP